MQKTREIKGPYLVSYQIEFCYIADDTLLFFCEPIASFPKKTLRIPLLYDSGYNIKLYKQ